MCKGQGNRLMNTLSSILSEKATQNRSKIHRSRYTISEKIVAFDALESLEHTRMSGREISSFLEVPDSTMRSWKNQQNALDTPLEVNDFFSTTHGAELLQKIVTAAILVIEYGPSTLSR